MTPMWNFFEAVDNRASKLDATLDLISSAANEAYPESIAISAERCREDLTQLMAYVNSIRNSIKEKETSENGEKTRV